MERPMVEIDGRRLSNLPCNDGKARSGYKVSMVLLLALPLLFCLLDRKWRGRVEGTQVLDQDSGGDCCSQVNLDCFQAKREGRRPGNGCPGAAPVAQPEEEGGTT
jgi:hypothetical protein